MDAVEYYTLVDLLALGEESLEEINAQQRLTAIAVLIKAKCKSAKRMKKKIITDGDVLNEYDKNGINGIKKMFIKTNCYLYETEFVYFVLFYHYASNWPQLIKIIESYDNTRIKK